MTVGAAPVEEEVGIFPHRRSVRINVTIVAKPRLTHFEQPVIDGTVGLVAVDTILEDRRMLKEKRSAPFRMAGVTVLVHAGCFEL